MSKTGEPLSRCPRSFFRPFWNDISGRTLAALRFVSLPPARYGQGENIQGGVFVPVYDQAATFATVYPHAQIFPHKRAAARAGLWGQLSGGKPIVATAHIFEEVSLAGLMEIWNEFVVWRKDVSPTLPEEERLFSTSMNSRKVWVIEDGAAFTIMYPEDY